MILWLLLSAAQVTTGAPDQPRTDQPAETLKIDILVRQPEPKCETQNSDEIVVCAEKADQEQHRLRPIANAAKYEKDESRAEFSIAENATILSEGEAAGLPQGVQSNRLMVRLKIGF